VRLINAGLKIDIITSNKVAFTLKKEPFLYEYIPDLIIDSFSDNSNPDFIIKFYVSNHNSLDIVDNIITINYSKECSTKDIITLLEYGLEYCRQSKDIYCLHGSAVAKSEHAIIFLGQVSGIGKTSISLELVLNHKFQFLGDEKILLKYINNRLSVKSTNRLKFNKSYLEDYSQINEKDFISKFCNISGNWIPLSLLIQPQICPKGILLHDKFDPSKTEFHLYEEITRKIRGCSRRVNGFTEPLLSIDNYELSKKRSGFCKKLSLTIDSYHVVGDKSLVGNFLDDLLSK
jgi:hypothetical protein